ncbi:MAG: HAD hydrolase-like protein [Fusicatenibacter sp.]
MPSLDEYQRTKDYLICVDSDGCAMDTMDIKHIRCFGPCLIEEWELFRWEHTILERWNEINLYTMTRGINRYAGLAKMLREVDHTFTRIEGIHVLSDWVEKSDELSNGSLVRAISGNPNICLKKALSWSEKVNQAIDLLPPLDKRPFEGVGEALEYAHQIADIVIVSSANFKAVEKEWKLYGLLEHVDILLAQDVGSKEFCIGELLKKGYDKENVLMVGDAPGDAAAAEKNGVHFYPILVRHEKESWREFRESTADRLQKGEYSDSYQEEKQKQFRENLGCFK